MNEQKIEQLKNALREILQLVASRNEPMSEELKQALVQLTQHITNRIQQLREEEGRITGGTPLEPKQPEITQSMPSSNIYGFNYDYDKNKLLVKFQGNGAEGQGPIYSYEGVQPYMFNLFKRGAAIAKTTGKNKWGEWWRGKSPSIGAAMHAFIKMGNYPYQRLS
jgi:hypothetical protein